MTNNFKKKKYSEEEKKKRYAYFLKKKDKQKLDDLLSKFGYKTSGNFLENYIKKDFTIHQNKLIDIEYKLSKIGNNVNQIARALHQKSTINLQDIDKIIIAFNLMSNEISKLILEKKHD